MLLSVQQAARRLGVSPVTIRRWTATGFLPCSRTAGGHRRIDEHDIDDLAKAIGNSNHLAAQLAREREVDVLINTSIALAGKIDLSELLLEIAMRMTSLLDCHFCAISEYDAEAQSVITLAEYDHAGRRLPDASPYKLRAFPLTRSVVQDQTTAVVNVDDPDADPAEVAELRREGDRSLLMAPLIVQGETIGILEVVDQKRSRQYSRQELRLAGAIAGQAAVAMHNAKVFAQLKRSDQDVLALRHAIEKVAAGHAALLSQATSHGVLQAAADLATQALDALSCVASCDGSTAGATGATGGAGGGGATQTDTAHVIVWTAPCGARQLALTLTLSRAAGEGQAELLGLIAAMAAGAIAGLPAA